MIKLVLALASLGFLAFQCFRSVHVDREKDQITVKWHPIIFSALAPILLIFVVLPSFGQVPAGHRGVVLRFGAVTGQILGEGLYAVLPFANSVELMDVQVHAEKAKASAASRDLQNVATEITLNYRVDPARAAEVYRDLRRDYVERIVDPTVQEAVKSATAQFDAEKLIVERPIVKERIEQFLIGRAKQHGLIIDGMSITDFQFSPEFSNAIEAKVTAVQQALKAENDLRRIKIEAEQRIAQAEGEAQAIRIQAESISKQGGPEYVRLKAIEKWNGSMPYVAGAATPLTLFNLDKITDGK